MMVDVPDMNIYKLIYEFVIGRYRHKKICHIMAHSKEEAETYLCQCVSGIDYITTHKLCQLNGISDELAEQFATINYNRAHKKHMILAKEAEDFKKTCSQGNQDLQQALLMLPDIVHIISKSVEE